MLSHIPRTLRPLSTRLSVTRPFSTSLKYRAQDSSGSADKSWRDRETINTAPNENSKTGSDPGSAAMEDTAFSKDKTSPEEQLGAADKESGSDSNPLNVSPANHEISKGDTGAGVAESSSSQSGKGPSDRERSSGPGSGAKSGQGKKYD